MVMYRTVLPYKQSRAKGKLCLEQTVTLAPNANAFIYIILTAHWSSAMCVVRPLYFVEGAWSVLAHLGRGW